MSVCLLQKLSQGGGNALSLSMAKGPKCDGKYHSAATGLKRKQRGKTGEHHVPSIITTYIRDLPSHSWDKQTKLCEEAAAETVRAFILYAGNCTCQ